MLVIVLSSIALASEDPVDEDSPRNLLLGYADYGFTAIFTLECTLKVYKAIIMIDLQKICWKHLRMIHTRCSRMRAACTEFCVVMMK